MSDSWEKPICFLTPDMCLMSGRSQSRASPQRVRSWRLKWAVPSLIRITVSPSQCTFSQNLNREAGSRLWVIPTGPTEGAQQAGKGKGIPGHAGLSDKSGEAGDDAGCWPACGVAQTLPGCARLSRNSAPEPWTKSPGRAGQDHWGSWVYSGCHTKYSQLALSSFLINAYLVWLRPMINHTPVPLSLCDPSH